MQTIYAWIAYMPAICTAGIRGCCHLDGLSTPNQSKWLTNIISTLDSTLHPQEKYYSDFWNTQLLRLIFNNSKTMLQYWQTNIATNLMMLSAAWSANIVSCSELGRKPLTRLTTRSILQRKTPGSRPLRTVTDRILQKRRVVTWNNILKGGLGHMTLNHIKSITTWDICCI